MMSLVGGAGYGLPWWGSASEVHDGDSKWCSGEGLGSCHGEHAPPHRQGHGSLTYGQ